MLRVWQSLLHNINIFRSDMSPNSWYCVLIHHIRYTSIFLKTSAIFINILLFFSFFFICFCFWLIILFYILPLPHVKCLFLTCLTNTSHRKTHTWTICFETVSAVTVLSIIITLSIWYIVDWVQKLSFLDWMQCVAGSVRWRLLILSICYDRSHI